MNVFGTLESSEKFIECEKVALRAWETFGIVKTCFLQENTIIDQPDVKFGPRDESMKGLAMWDNKAIFYLPEKIGDMFPNLMGIGASNCALKEITKDNFKGLNKLKLLGLRKNQIKSIASDTFENLIALEKLWLGEKNKSSFLIFVKF
jgi:Leucine rich repeat